jgi:hypothetical protein
MIAPPRWTEQQLANDLIEATALFRKQRMEEPIEAYLDAFDRYQGSVENLMETSMNLAELDAVAIDILTDNRLLEAFRYIVGPPLSADDLKTLSDSALSRKRLESDPGMIQRIVEIVRIGIDRRRFPWVAQSREPAEHEKAAAVLASAAMMAHSRTGTIRRNQGKNRQENLVEDALIQAGLKKIPARPIPTLNFAPTPGEFCRETILGSHKKGDTKRGRKADLVVGLWDHRIMPIECKVSNSAVNSVKRLNNDAARKAETWVKDFGEITVVPTAVLSGVYKLHNLADAQHRGLTLFWAHRLPALVEWIESTREKP